MLPSVIKRPLVKEGNMSVFAQYTIEVSERAKVQDELKKRGIPTAVHYPLGLHEQPIFKALYPSAQSFPNTEYASRHVMSLPMHPYLSAADQETICEAVSDIVGVAAEAI
jgi:UDP-2-acetamido-2-deoxy-ribo-hexuluronate aminotransferase